jgi:nucleoside-diphosphate-sugar epimerase
MKTALITGAAGFLGGAVAEEFRTRGWRVCGTVHRRPPLRAVAGATLLPTDIRDADSLARCVATAQALGEGRLDVIVHCAGRATDIGRRALFAAANTEPLRHLAPLAQRHRVGRFVFVSTTDVYGLRDHCDGDESLPLAPFPRNPYPESKADAERFLLCAWPRERYAVVRPAQIWGVGDRTLTARVVKFLRSSPAIVHFGPWRGANRWPLAHVRNVAKACYLAATRDEAAGRAFNVLDDERTTVDDYYRMVARLYMPEKRFRTVYLPFWSGVAWGGAVSALSTLLGRDRPLADPSHYALYAVSRNLDFSNRRLGRLFRAAGERMTSRAEGLTELASHVAAVAGDG